VDVVADLPGSAAGTTSAAPRWTARSPTAASSSPGNWPGRQCKGTLRDFASSRSTSRRRANSAIATACRYAARFSSRRAADSAPANWSSDRAARSDTACSVSADRTGPGRSTSAASSWPNAALSASPPRPSGPHIAASSAGSRSEASPRLIETAGPSSSHSSGIRTRPASISATQRSKSASKSKSSPVGAWSGPGAGSPACGIPFCGPATEPPAAGAGSANGTGLRSSVPALLPDH
jgi:hypothetical protein